MMVSNLQSLFAALLLTAVNVQALEEFIMPRMQQNTYLSHAQPAEQFGLRTVPGTDGPVIAGSAVIPPDQKVTVAFESGAIPLIRVRNNESGKAMNALIDSGSPVSWMEFGTSRDFEAVFLSAGKERLRYPGPLNTGGAPGYAAVIPRMDLGYVEISNTPLYVRMALHSLGPFARGIEAPQVDAAFGYDFLKDFEYGRFDFRNREVLFSSSDIYVPDVDLLMSVCRITEVPEGGLAVQGSISGVPSNIILDMAGDYFFSRGDVKVNVTRQVSLGDVVWRKMPTLLLPTGSKRAPRAGRKMLEKYIVTVCPKRGVVYFERFPE